MNFFGLRIPWFSLNSGDAKDLVSSIVLLVAVGIIRAVIATIIKNRKEISPDLKRRYLANLRNSMLTLIFAGMFWIWASELRTFALSIAALGAAIVFASAIPISNLWGAFVRSRAKLFEVGHFIEIGGVRGVVFDYGLFNTRIMEFGSTGALHQYTGRLVSVPNSMLMEKPLVNESFLKRYAIHTITIPLRTWMPFHEAERIVIDVANQECAAHLADIRDYVERIEKQESVNLPDVEPATFLTMKDPETITLQLRFTAPIRGRIDVEQRIIRRYIAEMKAIGGFDPPQSQADKQAPGLQ